MINLDTIRLDLNKISTIKMNTFRGLGLLKSISLQNNNIIKFNRNALIGLTNLEAIHLENNPLAIYFPNELDDICVMNNNYKCNVILDCLFYFNNYCL